MKNKIELKPKIVLTNGNKISEKNYKCIYAQSTNECTGVHDVKYIDTHKPYFEKWIIVKDDEGYIFREVAHGGGISGHHKTVRRCVISASSNRINIFYTPDVEHELINLLFNYKKFNTGNFKKEDCFYK